MEVSYVARYLRNALPLARHSALAFMRGNIWLLLGMGFAVPIVNLLRIGYATIQEVPSPSFHIWHDLALGVLLTALVTFLIWLWHLTILTPARIDRESRRHFGAQQSALWEAQRMLEYLEYELAADNIFTSNSLELTWFMKDGDWIGVYFTCNRHLPQPLEIQVQCTQEAVEARAALYQDRDHWSSEDRVAEFAATIHGTDVHFKLVEPRFEPPLLLAVCVRGKQEQAIDFKWVGWRALRLPNRPFGWTHKAFPPLMKR